MLTYFQLGLLNLQTWGSMIACNDPEAPAFEIALTEFEVGLYQEPTLEAYLSREEYFAGWFAESD